MQRFSGLVQLASRAIFEQTQSRLSLQATATRYLQSTSSASSEAVKSTVNMPDLAETEHATGMEQQEIEGLAKGVDIFHEAWIDAEVDGTPEDPVVVTSAYDERIVGVPDPEDDCLVVWGLIKENEPPRQLIEGGEYFVLKRVAPPTWSGIPEVDEDARMVLARIGILAAHPRILVMSPCFKGEPHH